MKTVVTVIKKPVMKAFYVLVLVAGFALPAGFAQVYLGAELGQVATSYATGNAADLSSRNVGAQLGLNVAGLGLRAAVEGNLAARRLESGSLDALLNVPFIAGSSLYLGAGADILDLSQLRTIAAQQTGFDAALQAGVFGAHAVAGAEARLGPFGVFGEVQPVYRLGQNATLQGGTYLRTRAGLNLHF